MPTNKVSKRAARQWFNFLTQAHDKYRLIASYLGESVFDLGCGSGTLIPFLRAKARYIGVDADAEAISRLRSQHPHHLFYCRDLDKDALPNFGAPFSSIVLIAVIEHLKNPDFVLHQCQGLMNDNTVLIITTPSRVGDFASRVFEGIFGNRKDPHPHVAIYNRERLDRLCQAQGLVPKHYQRLCWHRQVHLAIYARA